MNAQPASEAAVTTRQVKWLPACDSAKVVFENLGIGFPTLELRWVSREVGGGYGHPPLLSEGLGSFRKFLAG